MEQVIFMKGAGMSAIIAIIIIIIIAILSYFGKIHAGQEKYVEITSNAKEAYAVVHSSELIKRMIDSNVGFAVKKAVYEICNENEVWSTDYPKENNIEEKLKTKISKNLILDVEEIDGNKILWGNLKLNIGASDKNHLLISGIGHDSIKGSTIEIAIDEDGCDVFSMDFMPANYPDKSFGYASNFNFYFDSESYISPEPTPLHLWIRWEGAELDVCGEGGIPINGGDTLTLAYFDENNIEREITIYFPDLTNRKDAILYVAKDGSTYSCFEMDESCLEKSAKANSAIVVKGNKKFIIENNENPKVRIESNGNFEERLDEFYEIYSVAKKIIKGKIKAGFCTDSDNGQNYFAKGFVDTMMGKVYDRCIDSGGGYAAESDRLKEFYCNGDKSSIIYDCGCLGGACKCENNNDCSYGYNCVGGQCLCALHSACPDGFRCSSSSGMCIEVDTNITFEINMDGFAIDPSETREQWFENRYKTEANQKLDDKLISLETELENKFGYDFEISQNRNIYIDMWDIVFDIIDEISIKDKDYYVAGETFVPMELKFKVEYSFKILKPIE